MLDQRESSPERINLWEEQKGGQLVNHGALDAWRHHMQYQGHSPNSIRRRVNTLNKWLPYAGKVEVSTVRDVELWLGRWPEASTRRAYLGDLRSYYRFAVAHGLEPTDPTVGMDTPRVRKRRPTPVLADDVQALLSTTRAPNRTMIALAAFAGLRVSEIAAMHTDDIDIRAGLLAVRSGKGGKDRFVPLAPRLAGELAGWKRGPLFPGLTGRAVSGRISREMARLGINRRPHDLRAAFGTQLARVTGGNLVLVAQLMGHESIQTTMAYVDWSPDATDAIARLFAA